MILGIGVDMVSIDRMRKWCLQDGILKRFFHPDELEACWRNNAYQPESLAARFAAKEALGKALGCGMRELVLSDIEIRSDDFGAPHLHMHGRARAMAEQREIKSVHVSLGHEGDYSVAMVVLEGSINES